MMLVPICISLSAVGVILATNYAPHLFGLQWLVMVLFCLRLYSIAVALINDIVGPELRVKIAGAILIVYGFGAIIGPIVVGPLIDLMGVQALFVVSAVTSLFLQLWRYTKGLPSYFCEACAAFCGGTIKSVQF